jgi:2-methylcitrate dehydratase PrpD
MDSPSVLVGERGLNVKRYPCCYFAHRAADAMLELPRITADQIASIRVTTSPGALSALKHPRPSTGTEAKFSGPFIVAAAYLDRGLTLDTFTDEAVERVDIASLAGRIRWCESELPPHGPETWLDGYAVVELDTRRGATHVVRVDHPRGHAAYPLDDAELVTKFRDCARGRLRAGDLEVLAAELLHLDRSDDTTWQHADLTQCHSDSVKGI